MSKEQKVKEHATPAHPVVANDPGKTIGIVGFALSFVIGLAGLILSIIGYVKSKKAGYNNGLALAGIIIGAVSTVISIIAIALISVFIVNTVTQVIDRCGDSRSSSVIIDGTRYECPKELRTNGASL